MPKTQINAQPGAQPDGYLATPTATHSNGRAVLVLHAWWGLNDTIRAFCDRLAQNGFTALALDLYHGKVTASIPEAKEWGQALDAKHLQAKAEVTEAAQYLYELTGQHSIAVAAFSLGGYYAVDLSVAKPDLVNAVVLFYGAGEGDFSTSKSAYLGHFADQDEYEPRRFADDMLAAAQQAGRPINFHYYPNTKHWFFEPDRTQEFNPEAAQLAWDRTLAFLQQSS